MTMRPILLLIGSVCLAADPPQTVFGASGENPAAIQAAVSSFQNALGPLNPPGATGDANGRREINWDGVPTQFSAPNNLPADFFNRNSIRGVVFSADGPNWIAFQVSANEADAPVRFDTILQGYSSVFRTFSPQKLFASVGAHDYNADFFVPGTQTKAKVKGFGAVFTNVALPFSTALEFYNSDGLLLGRYYAPVAPGGLSFIGVAYANKMVARVRVIPGNAALGTADNPAGGVNIVVVDDFIYGEPSSDCVVN